MMDIELEEMTNGRLVKYSSFSQDKQTKIKQMKSNRQFSQLLDYANTMPTGKDRYLLKASALISLKRWQEVIECCDKGLQLEEDGQFYNMKARAYGRLNMMTEKQSFIRKAIHFDDKIAAYHRNLGATLYKLKRYDESLQEHQKAIKLQPNYSINYHNAGAACFRMENFDQAKKYFIKAVVKNEKESLSHYWLADCYKQTGDLKSASACYNRAYELSGRQEYKAERDKIDQKLHPKKGFFQKIFG